MAVIEINKNPTRRDLAIFGLLLLLFTGLVGAGLYFRAGAHEAARIVWMTGAGLVLLFFAVPKVQRPIYLGWIYATFPIGFVLSHLILGAVFYLVFTPLGLLMRLFGFDVHSGALPPSSEQLAALWRPYVETCVAAFRPQRAMTHFLPAPNGSACTPCCPTRNGSAAWRVQEYRRCSCASSPTTRTIRNCGPTWRPRRAPSAAPACPRCWCG